MDWMDSHSGLASWAQAIGSLVALVVAIWVAWWQGRQSRKLFRDQSNHVAEEARLQRIASLRATVEVAEIVARRQLMFDLAKAALCSGVDVSHTWLPKKANTASNAPMRKAQRLNARPNCLMLNCWAFASSSRAWLVALLCPKRSATITPVARLISEKVLLPLGRTMISGASGGGCTPGFW